MNKNSWKMRCVDGGNSGWEVGNVIVVKDNKGVSGEYGVDGDFSSFNNWCEERKRLGSKWELIEDSFTKSDLKPFMLVKLRRGDLCIVSQSKLGVSFNSEFGFMSFYSYNDELLCFDDGEREKYYDVMEVYDISNKYYDANKLSTDNRELLFKREEQSQRDIKIKELQDKMDAIKREMEELK
jgi:hypothetical protein